MRTLVSLPVAAATFVAVFLAIFIPLLIHYMHIAPHDGQVGLLGFVIGVPAAALASLSAGAYCYSFAKRREWFSS